MKLLERVDLVCRRRGMSGRTAQVYGQWIRRFLAFSAAAHGRWVPAGSARHGGRRVVPQPPRRRAYLSASSQNQGLNALEFLYKHVLEDAIARDHLGKFELLRSTRTKGGAISLSRPLRSGGGGGQCPPYATARAVSL
jgi:hypothetical protein